jgi:processive 1,2-diacylglycerol beta-glucosyltransferase
MRKILILYATAGAGHKKAAEAIINAAKNRSLEVQSLDIIDFMPGFAKKLYSDGYLLLISRFVWLWGILYFFSDTPWLPVLNVHLRRLIDTIACRRLVKFLKKDEPDVVISTHFLASEIVSFAKQKFNLKTRLITVVTDFGVHNFWINQKTDLYCSASQVTKQILIDKGIPPELIKVTGIPVDEKFSKPLDKNLIRAELGIAEDKPTVLIITGGIGVGPIEEIVDLLKDHVQLLVVCGHNKNLQEKLSRKEYPGLRVFGFVNYVEKLMSISQLIVTKAGGLTVTESLVIGLPMIFFFLIPGQELINAKTISREKAGLIAQSPEEIKEAVLNFKGNPDTLSAYKNRALTLAKPHSAAEIISLLDYLP